MNAAQLAEALGGRRYGRGWRALCPAHDDGRPSLDIREGSDGRLLVICRAGCPQAAVVGALRARGVWPEYPRPQHSPAERRAWAASEHARLAEQRNARWFGLAAGALAEDALGELPGVHPERAALTRLAGVCRRGGPALVDELRAWRETTPALAEAMVEAGRASERRVQRAVAMAAAEHWSQDVA